MVRENHQLMVCSIIKKKTMKKLTILSLVILAFSFTACDKENANKDVENCINKLNHFNTTFNEYNADGVISKEKNLGKRKDQSEFGNLKKIASEYYELMNKINSNIADEKEALEKGKKIDDYEKKYRESIMTSKSEIEKATSIFNKNIEEMKAAQ